MIEFEPDPEIDRWLEYLDREILFEPYPDPYPELTQEDEEPPE